MAALIACVFGIQSAGVFSPAENAPAAVGQVAQDDTAGSEEGQSTSASNDAQAKDTTQGANKDKGKKPKKKASGQEVPDKTSGKSSKEPSSARAKNTGSSSSSAKKDAGSGKAHGSASSSDTSTITVSISIDGSRAGTMDTASRATAKVKLKKGASVYDALVATGVSIGGDGYYVSAINGLAEKQCGTYSGWMYSVNGDYPNKTCGDYKLSGSEKLIWVYTCDLGNDL